MVASARLVVAPLVACAVLLAGCSAQNPDVRPRSSGSATASPGHVTVFAAASLSEAFERIGAAFESAHPGATVTLNFGGSSVLAEQLREGAPADVFAPADRSTMRAVENAGLVAHGRVFATNALEIAVPMGNPAGITGLGDLARSDVVVALCAAEVPCGASARAAFDAAGLTPRPDTLEQDVKAVLTRVRLGEADAGIVYRTDVLSAGDDVDGVPLPAQANVTNEYPIATLGAAPNRRGADAFVAFVLSDVAQSILEEAGFNAP